MRKIGIILLLLTLGQLYSQDNPRKVRYVFGTIHTKNTTINGIAVGAFPSFTKDEGNSVKTNGIRIEIPGFGILAPIANGSPISHIEDVPKKFNKEDFPYDEISNGINISGGSIGNMQYNGITLAAIAQFGNSSNGIALAGVWNSIAQSNGVQMAIFFNEALYNNGIQFSIGNHAIYTNGMQLGVYNYSKTMKGIQIGLFNKSKETRGIQLGLWNVNEKRKLPILNWSF